jgi:sugar (pentulose or hexulose) kinase
MDRLIVVGGAVQNPFWMQNKADMAGRSIEDSEVEEASPLDAAMLVGIGVGLYWDDVDVFAYVRKPGRVDDPGIARTAQYEGKAQTYKTVYSALSPVNRAIGTG